MQCTNIKFNSMLTLTYGKYYPRDGEVVKNDLKYMLKVVKTWSEDYLWFLEFQARGAPHFHLFLTTDCITPSMRATIAKKWVTRQVTQEYFWGYCPVGDNSKEVIKLMLFNIHDSVFELIKKPDGAKRYAAKYALKTTQKNVPDDYKNVGRFWGCTARVSRYEETEVDITEEELREVLKRLAPGKEEWDIIPKYLWGNVLDYPKP